MANPNFDQKLLDKIKREHSEFLDLYDENAEETDLDYLTEYEFRRFFIAFVSDKNRQLTLDEVNCLIDKVFELDEVFLSRLENEKKKLYLYSSFSVDIKKMLLNMVKVGE